MNFLRPTIVLILILSSCNTKTDNKSIGTNETVGTDVALKFINDYVNYCNNDPSELKTIKWIENNKLTTDQFRTSYKEIIEKATKENPEEGLGFDPIFHAQDYPEKGFTFLKSDKDGYVTVQGKDWSDFTIVIKVNFDGGKWKVDGAGIINIPKDKTSKK